MVPSTVLIIGLRDVDYRAGLRGVEALGADFLLGISHFGLPYW